MKYTIVSVEYPLSGISKATNYAYELLDLAGCPRGTQAKLLLTKEADCVGTVEDDDGRRFYVNVVKRPSLLTRLWLRLKGK